MVKQKITIDTLARMTQDEFSNIYERFDAVDARFDRIDKKLEDINDYLRIILGVFWGLGYGKPIYNF